MSDQLKKSLSLQLMMRIVMTGEFVALRELFAEEINPDILSHDKFDLEHAEKIASDTTKATRKTVEFIAGEIKRYSDQAKEMDFSMAERVDIESRKKE